MSHDFVRGQSVAEICFSHWGKIVYLFIWLPVKNMQKWYIIIIIIIFWTW